MDYARSNARIKEQGRWKKMGAARPNKQTKLPTVVTDLNGGAKQNDGKTVGKGGGVCAESSEREGLL